jgi:hypothetical protein
VFEVIRGEGHGEDALAKGQVEGSLILGVIKSGLDFVAKWTVMPTIGEYS